MNIGDAFPQFYIDADYDTYPLREELKELGFKWDPQKQQWWHKDEAERDAAYEMLQLKDEAEDRNERWDSPRSWIT